MFHAPKTPLFAALALCATSAVGTTLFLESEPDNLSLASLNPPANSEPEILPKQSAEILDPGNTLCVPLAENSFRRELVTQESVDEAVAVTLDLVNPVPPTTFDFAAYCDALTEPKMVRFFRGAGMVYPNGFRSFYYEDGSIQEQGRYFRNQKQGYWSGYHPDGSFQYQGTFNDNKMEGLWTHWNADGSCSSEGFYRDGEKVGKWYELNADNQGIIIDYSAPKYF